MTPRIPAIDPKKTGLLTRLIYRVTKRRYGEVPEPFAVAANHPGLLFANGVYEAMTERASTRLPATVRHLAVYQTARTIGCSWCADFGSMLMRLEGIDLDRLKNIDSYMESPLYSADERAAIAYAVAMTRDPSEITDEQVADLRERFGDAGVIELTSHIAIENMRARSNAALGIADQGFNSDGLCRVPWATNQFPGARSLAERR